MRTRRRARRSLGFTMIELMIVVATIGVLSTIAIPGFARAKARTRRAEFLSEMALWERSLLGYARVNGRMPSPPSGDPNFVSFGYLPAGNPGTDAKLDWDNTYLKELARGYHLPIERTRSRWAVVGQHTTAFSQIWIVGKHDFDGDGQTEITYLLYTGADLDHLVRQEVNFESLE